ncbi:MAG TPA: class I SAM-dependent methyltransferase [Candidatus Hydrogenedentes bacterium]|nr:class I SAM-dependent methyltransferase [Candidatus Hydrogenedentota bacterium]
MWLDNLLEEPLVYRLKTRLLSFGRRNVRDFLREFPSPPGHERVLDVGCGIGGHADAFATATLYVGIDENAGYVKYASARHGRRFVAMNATRIAFADGTFDLVFAAGLFHHLSDDQARAAAREMTRVTKETGATLIIDAVLPVLWNVPGRLLCRLDRGRHVRTVASLAALLANDGFQLHLGNIQGSFPYQRAVFLRCPCRP